MYHMYPSICLYLQVYVIFCVPNVPKTAAVCEYNGEVISLCGFVLPFLLDKLFHEVRD